MKYVSVRLSTIRSEEPLKFDLFVYVDARYLHYIRSSDVLERDRLTSLKKRGVKKLFIPEDQEAAYLEFLNRGLTELNSRKDLSSSEKGEVAAGAMMDAAEDAAKNLETEKGFKQTEDRLEKIMEFIQSEKLGMHGMLKSSGASESLAQHSSNVTTLALGLAPRMGLKDPKEILSLGVAALYHDLGEEKFSFPFLKPRKDLSVEELKTYHEHPLQAATLVSTKPYVDKTVTELIKNHEELGEGAGFPEKKILSRLPLSQRLLNLANEYDRMCMIEKIPPLQAVKKFFLEKMGLFELETIQQLQQIIQEQAGLK